jgi:hypothetical protein
VAMSENYKVPKVIIFDPCTLHAPEGIFPSGHSGQFRQPGYSHFGGSVHKYYRPFMLCL